MNKQWQLLYLTMFQEKHPKNNKQDFCGDKPGIVLYRLSGVPYGYDPFHKLQCRTIKTRIRRYF